MGNQNSNNFQRIGSFSNAHVGCDFERKAFKFFEGQGTRLQLNFSIAIGITNKKKFHKFDIGSEKQKIIIECKSHTWTEGNNVPSAKITVWNEAMYYFYLAPNNYRKIFFCLKDYNEKRKVTLARYYIDKYYHLIPTDVEIWEYCAKKQTASKLFPRTK